LLDKAAHLLVRVPGYAQVVVDEAQDLSAMQLRPVGRRCVTGTATVLGDLAQATAASAPGSRPEVLMQLGKPQGRLETLGGAARARLDRRHRSGGAAAALRRAHPRRVVTRRACTSATCRPSLGP